MDIVSQRSFFLSQMTQFSDIKLWPPCEPPRTVGHTVQSLFIVYFVIVNDQSILFVHLGKLAPLGIKAPFFILAGYPEHLLVLAFPPEVPSLNGCSL